jgi:hypothetical protein
MLKSALILSLALLLILLKNPHFLFLIDAKNAFDSNMKVARDKLLLALRRGSERRFSFGKPVDLGIVLGCKLLRAGNAINRPRGR